MPLVVQLPMLPTGFLAEDSFGGENAPAFVTEYLTTEDGNDFVQRAEGISNVLCRAFEALRVRPSQVDHLLAVIRPDRGTTVYCNELHFKAVARHRIAKDTGLRAG